MYRRFRTLPVIVQVILVLLVIGLLVVASPLSVFLATLALLISLFAWIYRLVRRRPSRGWGLAALASLILLIIFSTISQALYGGGTPPSDVTPPPPETTEETKQETTIVPTAPIVPTPPSPQPTSPSPQPTPPSPEPAAPTPRATGSADPLPDGSCPPEFPIKGNASSGIYHTPGKQFYNKTKAEACFARPSDAQAAGFKAAQK
jgi:hypothetical protein